jgi:short-subunit dehydrogenase
VSAQLLTGKRALITGASSGIGEAFAREFARQGFDLVLVARRADALQQLAAELGEKYPVDIRVQACDLLAANATTELFEACAGLDIDVLVNNAGLMYHGSFAEEELANIDAIVGLNVACLTRLSRLFLVPMLAKGSGRILNISSTTGFKAGPTVAVYAASKAYIISFTEALAEELRGSGVTATAFCPGSTDTAMVATSFGEDLRTDPVGSLLMMPAEAVARSGFKACMSGEVIAIPGTANNIISSLGRLQPRWMSRRLQAYLYRKLLDEK